MSCTIQPYGYEAGGYYWGNVNGKYYQFPDRDAYLEYLKETESEE